MIEIKDVNDLVRHLNGPTLTDKYVASLLELAEKNPTLSRTNAAVRAKIDDLFEGVNDLVILSVVGALGGIQEKPKFEQCRTAITEIIAVLGDKVAVEDDERSSTEKDFEILLLGEEVGENGFPLPGNAVEADFHALLMRPGK